MNEQLKRILFYTINLLFLFVVLNTCQRIKENEDMSNHAVVMLSDNQNLLKRVNDKDRELRNFKDSVLQAFQVEVNAEVTKRLGTDKTLGVDKPKVIVQTRLITKIDTLFVETTDTIKVSEELNLPFSKTTDLYSISGKIRKNGIQFDSLAIPSKITWSLGTDKKGLFKRSESVVRVSSDNPLVKIRGMDNYVVKNNPKWYQSNGFWLGAGFLAGITGTIILLK